MTLSVIGASFGRTGTMSLKIALEQLGIGRCYHMIEVFENPGHAELWHAAAEGKLPDWDDLFAGYSAAVDWPPCSFWGELLDHYPDAEVILTVRDPERWYQSVASTIYPVLMRPLETDGPGMGVQRKMALKLILEQSFHGRFEDREYMLALYERHNEEVKQAVSSKRLLVYEIAEGWAPLCRFLDRPIPDGPFPRVNSTDEFRGRFKLDNNNERRN